MGKKILDSKALYVVLSIMLTIVFWCYVTSTDGTPQNEDYSNVPVVFTGVDILEERGLMIVNQNITTTVTARATPAVHARLSNGGMTVTVNVSSVSEDGPHMIAYSVNLPADVSDSEVDFISGIRGNVVNINVARYLSRKVPVRGSFQGQPAEGYLAGNENDFQFSPGSIVVSGQADLVNQVAYARVTIDEEGLTDTVSGELPFELIGASEDVLKDLDVTCDVDTVYVMFPIWATAEIPLEVTLIPGGGLGINDVDCHLSAESIFVAGSQDAVTGLAAEGSIKLGTIDLAAIRDGEELTIPVPLDDELTNLSGPAEVRVTITLKKQVVSRTFAATHIQLINRPEGWNVDVVTKELPVEIRGDEALIDELMEENIRVVADLQNINQAAGQYTVPAKIYLDNAGSKSEIGEMSSNYTIVVTLTPED